MYDLREHKELISQLVSEADQNDPNWEWSVRRLSKNVACIFWGYLEYCDEAELSFSIKLGEADGRCWVEARNEHGWILESEIVADKDLPFLNCPIDKAIEKMVRLDWYMKDFGNKGGWVIDHCYLKENSDESDV